MTTVSRPSPPFSAGPLPRLKGARLHLILACLCGAASALRADPHLILYVDNSAGNDISVVDAVTQKAIGSIQVCNTPHGVVGSPDGTRLYVSSEAEDTVTAIDTATSGILWTTRVGVRPNEIAISADGRYLYVPIRTRDYVDVVDTQARKVVKSVKIGNTPHNAYRSANGKWIYATSRGLGAVALIDTATQEVIKTIPLGGEIRPGAFTSDDKFFFGQLTGMRGFVVADVEAGKVVKSAQLPPVEFKTASIHCYTASHGIAVTKDDKQVWSVSGFGDAIDVLSIPDYTLVKSVPVGIAPDWADITPDGKIIYVANTASDDVSALDVAQMREIARIKVGKTPKRLAIVNVPSGMSGPGDKGWDAAAARPATTDVYLRGGGTVSCSTASFKDKFASNELTAESVPALYRKLGILGIEFDADQVPSWDHASVDRIAEAVRKEGRMVTAIDVGGSLVSDDDQANQRQIEADRRILRAARSLGAPVVCVRLGEAGNDTPADVVVERAAASLRSLLPTARELGIRLVFENADGPAANPDAIVKIIKETDPTCVGLCFNFRYWDNQKAMNAGVEKLAPYVFHAHIAAAAFDKLGNESKIDYKSGLALLSMGAYGNALSIVISGMEDPQDGASKMVDLLTRYWIGVGTDPRPVPAARLGK